MEQLNLESTKIITTHLRLSSNFIKKSLSLLQSSYFVSLLFFSSSLVLLIFHTLEANFSPSFLVSVLKLSFDRNHMFLLCNGILVILVKSSSSSPSSSVSSPPSQIQNSTVFELVSERKQVSELITEKQSTRNENPGFFTVGENSSEELQVVEFFDVHDLNEDIYDQEEKEEEEEEEEGLAAEELNRRCEEQSYPEENPRFFTIHDVHDLNSDIYDKKEEEEEEKEENSEFFGVRDGNEDDYYSFYDYDEEEEQEGEEGLAAEELNRRCEEFIRKMKQGIISESRGCRS